MLTPARRKEGRVSFLSVLPLAVVMVAGPQLISAVMLATGQDARRNSLAFLAGAALAVAVGTLVAYGLFRAVEIAARPTSTGTVGTVIDWLVVALLLLLMVRTYLRRKDTRTPKWMGKLQSADATWSFRLGLLLFLVMPTDILTMVTVGASLARRGDHWWQALPFVVLTLLLVGLPLIDLVLLGKRAQVLLPRVRDWMSTHSWVINEVVLAFFLALTILGLGG
jgi:threonine/homoserine/homoserine lactone efflux protein